MSFDDTTFRTEFLPPPGSQFISWIKGTDEAGFLFSETLEVDGATAVRRTDGPGGPACKDVVISLVLAQSSANAVAVPVPVPPPVPAPTFPPNRLPTPRPTTQPTPQATNTVRLKFL